VKKSLLLHYCKLAKWASNKKHLWFVHSVLFAIGIYYPIKTLSGWSFTLFATRVFSIEAAIWIKWIGVVVVIYAAAARLFVFIVELVPVALSKTPEPESINECVLKINNEIRRHLGQICDHPESTASSFLPQHYFEENVLLVTANMADHLLRSFSSLKAGNHDIFISVYKIKGFEEKDWEPETLEYVTHWDLTRQDVVSSPEIKLSDVAYSEYECIKAIRGAHKIVKRWDCNGYASGRGERAKTIRHYVGFRLEHKEKTIGFINVEFHNHIFFLDEIELTNFVEKVLIAFRYLIEYQFLKRKFFTALHNQLK
jgi:hypothetical protein